MRSRKERRLFPRATPTERRWFAASAAAHVVALIALVIVASRTFEVERRVTMIPLDTVGVAIQFPSATPRHVAQAAPGERAPGALSRPTVEPPARDTTVAAVQQVVVGPVAVLPPPRDTMPHRPPPARAEPGRRTGTGARGDSANGPVGTHRRLGPLLNDSTRPLWSGAQRLAQDMLRAGQAGVTRGEVAAAQPLDSAQRRQMMDSVVKDRLRTFLAALPPDSMAAPKAQKWTDTINGKPWGIDGQWIYLGDLKIPTAILALLPLPSGNYDQAQQAKNLQYMRDDIIQAAQRAQNQADFQRYLKEVRTRHDAERAADRARAGQVSRDTVIKQ